MSKFDKRGNPVSYHSQSAIDDLDKAFELLAAYQADPMAATDAILAEHPDFVMAHAFRAGMFATATDKAFEAELIKSVTAAEALAGKANGREQLYIKAARAWLDGDFERGVELWGRVSIAYPRDLTALQFAHVGDFFLGYSHMLRDRVARVLPHWDRGVPGYGFVLGMYAFGLEEAGEYALAEENGREAYALNPQDGWAAHAVAHVLEMQGRAKEGVDFLGKTAGQWAPNSLFAYHLFWHKALFHIDTNDAGGALNLHDEKVSAGGFGQALELLDGSALLWRLQLLGHDVGERWNDLADKWETRLDDGYYVFNDANAMMALVGTQRTDAQKRLIASVKRRASGQGTNAMMCREVGVPACEGLAAFGRGDYALSIEFLSPVRAKANRFGGSHAQRDMFSWTLTEAAIRLGDRALADAFVAERLSWKPESPVNRAWAARAATLKQVRAG
ncbi:MAG: tetratricopeptide repeat protein [Alphaproteobacteria bacterium]|nr:tetratricopeptide repeat protein [Alphaproteobacteria bacterium]